jgi:hypothetical protein
MKAAMHGTSSASDQQVQLEPGSRLTVMGHLPTLGTVTTGR